LYALIVSLFYRSYGEADAFLKEDYISNLKWGNELKDIIIQNKKSETNLRLNIGVLKNTKGFDSTNFQNSITFTINK
jgi:hypothetical protein